MSLIPGSSVLSTAEPLLLAGLLCAFWKVRAHRKFPAFGTYLACRLGLYVLLGLLLYAVRFGLADRHVLYRAYYYIYWVGYLCSAGIVFLVIQETFTHLMAPLPGLGRLGLIAFRWAALTSVLIAVALSIFPAVQDRDILIAVTSGVMRCMSILQLCLLAFIVLSMHSLDLSFRSRDFGVAMGLSLTAAADMFGSAFAFRGTTIASVANYSIEIAIVLAIATWLLYFVLPEWQTKPSVPVTSASLLRWDEVATALGTPPPQLALGSSSDFFLRDVERAVDKILEKNAVDPVR